MILNAKLNWRLNLEPQVESWYIFLHLQEVLSERSELHWKMVLNVVYSIFTYVDPTVAIWSYPTDTLKILLQLFSIALCIRYIASYSAVILWKS